MDNRNKREDMLIAKFDKDKISILVSWKEFYKESEINIRDRLMQLIEEDFKKNKMPEKIEKIRKINEQKKKILGER